MKKLLVLLLVICCSLSALCQLTPQHVGLKHYSYSSPTLGSINYYVSTAKIDSLKPVLLYIDGSGPLPLYQYTERGIMGGIPFDIKEISKQYHLVVISKPGVSFADSVRYNDSTGYPQSRMPDEYRKRLSLNWRVNACDAVLKDIGKHLKVDKKHIVILGISEGFQVGAALLSVNKSITHAILLVGNGLNQFYDFIVQARTDAVAGRISYDDAEGYIKQLQEEIADIYAHPNATDKEWQGHTYLRWSSFCNTTPMEHILATDIPIYIAVASRDRNTSVLSADYIYLESLKQGRKNISYHVLPYDHMFNEFAGDNPKPVANHTFDVITDALKWVK